MSGVSTIEVAREARTTLRRALFICLALALVFACALVAASLVGSERLPAGSTLCALFSFGKTSCGLSAEQSAILFDIRLPRILLGAAVGASLAAAGAGYQALLRNP
ncbi:MAG: iron chelate uptake ABC transporter family permease subunit, partial [Pyrinomonadaceae bacterium]